MRDFRLGRDSSGENPCLKFTSLEITPFAGRLVMGNRLSARLLVEVAFRHTEKFGSFLDCKDFFEGRDRHNVVSLI